MNLFHALSRPTAALAFAVFIGSQLSVCSSGLAASIDVDNVRSSLMLKSEPAGAMTPTAAKAAVAKAPKQARHRRTYCRIEGDGSLRQRQGFVCDASTSG